MKRLIAKYSNILASLVVGVVVALSFTACEKEDARLSAPIKVEKVYLQDVNSEVLDREVEFARLGQLIRLEGSGFTGMKRVFINGYSCYFNPVYVSDNSMLVSVSKDVPVMEADAEVRNTIRLVKDDAEFIHPFMIRSSAPSISQILNAMPNEGEPVVLLGSGLVEITKVVFPGGVEVTEGIVLDEEGEMVIVPMPVGVSIEGGAIFVEGSNGGAYSPSYFNNKKGMLLDFDGAGEQGSWGRDSSTSMLDATDLEETKIGEGNTSTGKYCPLPRKDHASVTVGNRKSEVWTAGAGVDPDWTTLGIPAETPVAECGIQFEIYVPTEWKNSGYLKICGQNGFNGGEWANDCYNFVPWLTNGKVVPFKTAGWQTVTIPFSEFYISKTTTGWVTLADVAATRAAASYANFGFFFENSDFNLSNITGLAADDATEFAASATPDNFRVYIDNWRIVSITKPAYSDFPTEE